MADAFMLSVAAGLLFEDGKSDAFVDEVMAAHGWPITADDARIWVRDHGDACRCADCRPVRAVPRVDPVQLTLI
ncbi:hypothetical protein [Thioclava sp. GXIMD2076]|uniref:hypothetical protein n=1 Tax=Thioclava sp. GXIMD2076 TaxID=3131931 RepID=UPI0030CDD97C